MTGCCPFSGSDDVRVGSGLVHLSSSRLDAPPDGCLWGWIIANVVAGAVIAAAVAVVVVVVDAVVVVDDAEQNSVSEVTKGDDDSSVCSGCTSADRQCRCRSADVACFSLAMDSQSVRRLDDESYNRLAKRLPA